MCLFLSPIAVHLCTLPAARLHARLATGAEHCPAFHPLPAPAKLLPCPAIARTRLSKVPIHAFSCLSKPPDSSAACRGADCSPRLVAGNLLRVCSISSLRLLIKAWDSIGVTTKGFSKNHGKPSCLGNSEIGINLAQLDQNIYILLNLYNQQL